MRRSNKLTTRRHPGLVRCVCWLSETRPSGKHFSLYYCGSLHLCKQHWSVFYKSHLRIFSTNVTNTSAIEIYSMFTFYSQLSSWFISHHRSKEKLNSLRAFFLGETGKYEARARKMFSLALLSQIVNYTFWFCSGNLLHFECLIWHFRKQVV